MTSHISEFQEARERFSSLTKCERKDNPIDNEITILDYIVQKLCTKDEDIHIGYNSMLFYELILHADFLQIKNELIETFYTELCNTFIPTDILGDIVRNLRRLEFVPHVKKFLIQGLFPICQIKPLVRNDILILRYSREKKWYDVNLDKIKTITVLPSAYEANMLPNKPFGINCLNLLLRLCNVKRLVLSGCRFCGRSVQPLLQGLEELESLDLSECDSSVNEILQNNVSGIMNNLKELDVSRILIVNKTLEKIRWIPLKHLNLTRCIKNSGRIINTIWFPQCNGSRIDEAGKDATGNIDILWETGVLKQTIESLNVSYNDLNRTNLQLILQRQLKVLDITGCLQLNSVDLLDLVFPRTLKVLKARLNKFFFEDFKVLSETHLQKLEIDYYEKNTDDYSDFTNSSLMKTLKELTIRVEETSSQFIPFLSKFEFNIIRCKGTCAFSEYEKIHLYF